MIRRLVGIAAIGLLAAAVLKELFQPRGFRVREGSVLGVPYSFRLPGPEDVRRRYWNPGGDLLGPPLFGVGVLPNLPAILRRAGLWPD